METRSRSKSPVRRPRAGINALPERASENLGSARVTSKRSALLGRDASRVLETTTTSTTSSSSAGSVSREQMLQQRRAARKAATQSETEQIAEGAAADIRSALGSLPADKSVRVTRNTDVERGNGVTIITERVEVRNVEVRSEGGRRMEGGGWREIGERTLVSGRRKRASFIV